MPKEEFEPVVLHSFKATSSPVVVKSGSRKEANEPVVVNKRKSNVRQIQFDIYKRPSVSKVKLRNLHKTLIDHFKTYGYQMNENRARDFIAAMLSSRLVFLNNVDRDILDILFSYFGCMPNVLENSSVRTFGVSDTLKAVVSARYNKEAVGAVVVKGNKDSAVKLFNGVIKSPYDYNSIEINIEINGRNYQRITIPENVWIFVLTDDDHGFNCRKYGAYAKLSIIPSEKEERELKIPSYHSFKEAFIDVNSTDESIWNYIDEIEGLLKRNGIELENRVLNSIDDYLVSLIEMGMNPLDALDHLIINKIAYVIGENNLNALGELSILHDLPHAKKKIGGLR